MGPMVESIQSGCPGGRSLLAGTAGLIDGADGFVVGGGSAWGGGGLGEPAVDGFVGGGIFRSCPGSGGDSGAGRGVAAGNFIGRWGSVAGWRGSRAVRPFVDLGSALIAVSFLG